LISAASTVTGDGRSAESMGNGLKEESKRDVGHWCEAKLERQITITQIVGQGKRSGSQITCVITGGKPRDVISTVCSFFMFRSL
jgi:hypothetical protein